MSLVLRGWCWGVWGQAGSGVMGRRPQGIARTRLLLFRHFCELTRPWPYLHRRASRLLRALSLSGRFRENEENLKLGWWEIGKLREEIMRKKQNFFWQLFDVSGFWFDLSCDVEMTAALSGRWSVQQVDMRWMISLWCEGHVWALRETRYMSFVVFIPYTVMV